MNAFCRKDAVGSLESYAAVIVLHLALTTFFPKNSARRHWQSELGGFKKILTRFDKAKKKSRHNFNRKLIEDVLCEEFLDNHEKDLLLSVIDAKGLQIDTDAADWPALKLAVKEFAASIV